MLLHIARFHLFLWLNSILVCVCVCGPHLHSSIHPLVGTEQLFSYLSYGKSTIPSFNIPFFFLGFHGGLAGKQSACNTGDLGSVPGLGRSPGEGKGYPLQCCGLENSMDCPELIKLPKERTHAKMIFGHPLHSYRIIEYRLKLTGFDLSQIEGVYMWTYMSEGQFS